MVVYQNYGEPAIYLQLQQLEEAIVTPLQMQNPTKIGLLQFQILSFASPFESTLCQTPCSMHMFTFHGSFPETHAKSTNV